MLSTLAERLLEAMKGPPQVSAAELARACKVKPPSVNGWTSGDSKTMEASNLLAAARLCGVSPDWLATGIGGKKPSALARFTGDVQARMNTLGEEDAFRCENVIRAHLGLEPLRLPAKKKAA